MGYSSYNCKHCERGILDASSTDEGINEWMAAVVMMSPNGSRMMVSEYSGYAGEYDNFTLNGSVWVHEACWELAGRPGFDSYDGGSSSDEHQGGGGKHAHFIDPRITDEAERERLLAAGLEKREARHFTRKAREVHEWLDPSERRYHKSEIGDEMWRLRWSYFETTEYGDDHKPLRPKDGTMWYVSDKLDYDYEQTEDERTFRGTEDELKAELAARWARFVESDEAKKCVEHREAEVAAFRAEQEAKMRAEGRYEVSYGPAPAGDIVTDPGGGNRWQGSRSIYTVRDKLTYKQVAKFDGPDKALGVNKYVRDPDYDGNNSPEWEARVEAIRAAGSESARLAKEEAQRLNEQWAADGYPTPDYEAEFAMDEPDEDEGEPSTRKFYRTTITIEVLSENPIDDWELADIVREADEGELSGDIKSRRSVEMDGPTAARALTAQGSDPEFFNLDDKGRDLE